MLTVNMDARMHHEVHIIEETPHDYDIDTGLKPKYGFLPACWTQVIFLESTLICGVVLSPRIGFVFMRPDAKCLQVTQFCSFCWSPVAQPSNKPICRCTPARLIHALFPEDACVCSRVGRYQNCKGIFQLETLMSTAVVHTDGNQ